MSSLTTGSEVLKTVHVSTKDDGLSILLRSFFYAWKYFAKLRSHYIYDSFFSLALDGEHFLIKSSLNKPLLKVPSQSIVKAVSFIQSCLQ